MKRRHSVTDVEALLAQALAMVAKLRESGAKGLPQWSKNEFMDPTRETGNGESLASGPTAADLLQRMRQRPKLASALPSYSAKSKAGR